MTNDKYAEYKKKTADKPTKVYFNFKEGEDGYDTLVALKKKYNMGGVKQIIADALNAFVE